MLLHLGPAAKKKLLQLVNASWRTGTVPQQPSWCLCTRSGKTKQRPTATVLSAWPAAWASSQNTSSTPDSCGTLKYKDSSIQSKLPLDRTDLWGIRSPTSHKRQKTPSKKRNTAWLSGLACKKAFDDGHMYKWINQYLKNRRAKSTDLTPPEQGA